MKIFAYLLAVSSAFLSAGGHLSVPLPGSEDMRQTSTLHEKDTTQSVVIGSKKKEITHSQLNALVETGVVASQVAYNLEASSYTGMLLSRAQQKSLHLVATSTDTVQPATVGRLCHDVVKIFALEIQKTGDVSLRLPSQSVALTPAPLLSLKNKIDQSTQTQPYHLLWEEGLQPYCVYQFESVLGSQATSGCRILYTILAAEFLARNQKDLKPYALQELVQKMLAVLGTQEYMKKKDLQSIVQGLTPDRLTAFLEQTEKEGIQGDTDKVESFCDLCLQPEVRDRAYIITTFGQPDATGDRVVAIASKRDGQVGPVFIYIDPLNRKMSSHKAAHNFLTYLQLKAQTACLKDSMP